MSEQQHKNHKAHEARTAYREFCYRWTCDCGQENRVGEIIAGESNVCDECQTAVKIDRIVYDNGCVGRIGVT